MQIAMSQRQLPQLFDFNLERITIKTRVSRSEFEIQISKLISSLFVRCSSVTFIGEVG